MKFRIILLALTLGVVNAWADSTKLTGTWIGSTRGYDYDTSTAGKTVNLGKNALDGDLTTYFASGNTSLGWVGLDLGSPHVIDRVGYAAAPLTEGPSRTLLGIFEGANKSDFTDAVPLYMIKTAAPSGSITYGQVNVSRGFRYVRYIGPNNTRCNIAEVEFWGEASEGDDSQFYQVTNLPTVFIHTSTGKDPTDKVTDIVSNISIVSENGTKLLQDSGTSRLRGNNSATWPKKPYHFKFAEKHRVLHSPAKAKKWNLINNYGDKTLLRNCLAFEISKRMGIGYTPFCQPVDVIMNGEYKGCYQLCDQVGVHKDRVDITEMDSTCIEGEELTGGYLIEIDAYASKEVNYFTSTRSTPVTIKYPDDDDLLDVQFNYIKSHYNEFETSLYKTATWKDPDAGYRHYLNLASFIRHFLVGELSGNTDTYWSTYMYKDRNETQFFVEPVWDFDLAFENDKRTYPICDKTDYVYRTNGSHAGNFNTIVDRILMYDSQALTQLRETWALARLNQDLNAASLQQYVDSLANELQESQTLNFIRWPIMNTKVHSNPVIWGSYDNEVKNVRDYLSRRFTWMDSKLRYTATVTDIANVQTPIKDNVHIWGGRVFITGFPGGTPYQIYDVSGSLLSEATAGEAGPSLQPGIYIVRINNQSTKISVSR